MHTSNQVEKIAAELEAVSKTLDAQVFEKALESLAQDMPEGVFSIAEQVGSEMNEFKVCIAQRLRAKLGGTLKRDTAAVLQSHPKKPPHGRNTGLVLIQEDP